MNAAVADALDARYDTTKMARQDTVLSPHFYTTDFDALDRIDVEPVRAEWDKLMAGFEADANRCVGSKAPVFMRPLKRR